MHGLRYTLHFRLASAIKYLHGLKKHVRQVHPVLAATCTAVVV